MADKKTSKKGLTKTDLQALQERSRKLQDETAGTKQPARGLAPPAWMIHLTMGIIILVGILILGIQSQSRDYTPKKDEKPFEPADYIGVGARLPIGCVEVKGAEYANIKDLASGSNVALNTQKSFIQDRKYPLEVENSVGMRFRIIPGPASFSMGSKDSEADRGPDETEHVEWIQYPFYMGKYEVTQAQFYAVMKFNPSQPNKIRKPNQPVQEVTWHDARRFCKRLCEMEGLPAGSYRMPFEKEWEYACRAHTVTPYYFGDDSDKYFKFAVLQADGPEEVGSKRPNAWGLYNMHGNVWEWCQNKFYLYESKQSDDQRRAIRGGSWRVPLNRGRSAKRQRLTPTSHGNFLGFRVLRVITDKTFRTVMDESLPSPGEPDLAIPEVPKNENQESQAQ